MAMYQNMLVVIDPNQDDQPALRRAVYLHQRIGGKIKAFLPIYDFSYEMTTLLSPDERTAMRQGVISQRTAWIHEQAKYYLNAGVPIEIKVVWHNRPFEAIIQEVISGGHDLVLKMAHQHDRLEAVIFTPTDWHLLRKCPSPVWMVKDQPWPEGGKALVAVNLASEEPYHNALNEKLVKETVDYESLEVTHHDDMRQVDEIVNLIVETVMCKNDKILIASNWYPASLVKKKFLMLTYSHIEYVLHCMSGNTTKVKNIKKYLLAALFNAPSTMNGYYQAEVNHDMPGLVR